MAGAVLVVLVAIMLSASLIGGKVFSSGDNIYLQMPYGTFRYRVYFHKIVSNTDWSILRGRSYEKLVLSACHPLYSATHRWVVFARLQGEARPRSTGRATSSRRSRS